MERPQPQLGTQNQTASDRVLAWFMDTFIIIVISVLVAFVFDDDFLFFQTWVVGSFGYHTVLEALYGQTVGKKVVDIVVVKENGDPCDWPASIIRNAVRIIDSLLFYLVGLVVIFLSDNDQRLGDIVANTIVTEVAPAHEPPEPEPEPKPEPVPESDFEIELHHEKEGEGRYVVLYNKSGEAVDLSRGTLQTDPGSGFPLPQDETAQKPGHTKSIPVPRDATIEPGSPVTLLTRSGQRYDISWRES